MLIATFCQESFVLFVVFYGVLNGIGISLIYIPTVITTSKWFLKQRMLANCLNVLAACLGAALYPCVCEFVMTKYNLFDTIFILAGVQINFLVGSLLLRNNEAVFLISKLNGYKRRRRISSTQNGYAVLVDHPDETSKSNANVKLMGNQRFSSHFRGNANNLSSSDYADRISVTTTNSSIAANYTLKQYWRKFVQTRKSEANGKKNLFHLIADEKRKTQRTLSKASLEDGFVITTSNNLLAPTNDDDDTTNVIISRGQQRFGALAVSSSLAGTAHNNNTSRIGASASRLLTRIANSLRSLVNPQQQQNTNAHSSPVQTAIQSRVNVTKLDEKREEDSVSPPPAIKATIMPLLSVFDGPITETTLTSTPNVPANLASVFSPSSDTDNSTTITSNTTQQTNLAADSNSGFVYNSDSDSDDEDDSLKKVTIQKNASNQMNRYLSYRSSLTNSMRGSMIELALPEVREGVEMTDDDLDKSYSTSVKTSRGRAARNNTLNSKIQNQNGQQQQQQQQQQLQTHKRQNQDHRKQEIDLKSPLINLRRKISVQDSASFFNTPINIEPVEFNLRNSLIKDCSDSYRKRQNSKRSRHKSCGSYFLSYLNYLTNFSLINNSMMLVLNVSFFFVVIGMCVPLVYLSEFIQLKSSEAITKTQSIYFVSLIGLMTGLGRCLATIVYKVNTSSPKNRVFSYSLTLLFTGACLVCSTYICDTVYSFVNFSIMYGTLLGFHLGLRSMIIYDILGLEWSDDSLFSYIALSQSMGAFIGIPVAGLIYDATKSYDNVFHFAGLCFIMSSFVIMPGRKWRVVCSDSIKLFNKFYSQRRV
jgi:MFS family permease